MPDLHLQPPHIQLGFYWHDRPQEASFAACLRWLFAEGYEVARVRALRSVDGRLPPFQQPASLTNPEAEWAVFEDWDAATLLSSVEWLPILCHLSPTTPQNVPVHLNYALLYDASYHRGDAHAIEITASAADLDLLVNVDASELEPDVIAEAHRTSAWERRTFRAVCEALSPTCAADYCEHELQPPAYLAESGTAFDFRHFFVSHALDDLKAIESLVAPLKAWSTQRFTNGLLIKRGRGMDGDDAEGSRVAEALRGMLRASFS